MCIRDRRELYVGNLPVGMVNAQQLKELFRAPLLTMPNIAPEESAGTLINNVDLSMDGKFAFVEFRDEAICTLALTLFDKMEVCGRSLNVGRPRGYIDPNGVPPPMPGMPPMPVPSAPPGTNPLLAGIGGGMGGGPPPPPGHNPLLAGIGLPPPPGGLVPPPPPPMPATKVVKLEGMLTQEMLDNDDEYAEVLDDIKTECEGVGGPVVSVTMPRGGEHATLCFVVFADEAGAAKARASLHERQFDGNTVKATFITEADVPAA